MRTIIAITIVWIAICFMVLGAMKDAVGGERQEFMARMCKTQPESFAFCSPPPAGQYKFTFCSTNRQHDLPSERQYFTVDGRTWFIIRFKRCYTT